jgi:hypothetical protein
MPRQRCGSHEDTVKLLLGHNGVDLPHKFPNGTACRETLRVVTMLAGGTGRRQNLVLGMAEAPGPDPGRGGMHVVLLALGLAVIVAGFAVALGLSVEGSPFGNTLIVAGTIVAIGSLILSALATAIRQLRRIAQALEARPFPRAPEPEADEVPREAPRVPPPLRAPVVEPAIAAEAEPRIEPMIEPLPEPARQAPPEPVQEVAEQAPAVSVSEPAPLAPKPEPERTFDAVWSGGVERPRREPAVATVGVAVVEAVRPEPLAAPPEPETVRIFKSGVIDGMAYTLYTDGSIEAELPQGTVKFASIDELRAYLTARE